MPVIQWTEREDEIFPDVVEYEGEKNGKKFVIVADTYEGETDYSIRYWITPDFTIYINEEFKTLKEAKEKCEFLSEKVIEV